MNKIKERELKEIFLEIKSNKQTGYEKLYSKYNKLVYAIAFSILKNQIDAEDITQTVFAKIYELEISMLPSKNEASWLYALTRNEAISLLRKKNNHLDIENIYELENTYSEIEGKELEKEFTIKVYDKSLEGLPRDRIILASVEERKYGYSIHGYNVSVNVVINGEEISLRNALLEDKITMDEILAKAEKESKNTQIYKDGGSKSYSLEGYTIIKLNRLEDSTKSDTNIPIGPKDVYFGMPDFNINDIGK